MALKNDRYRQDHDKMRAAAELLRTGSAATNISTEHDESEPIPGEHDHAAEPRTDRAIVGGTGFGNDLPPTDVDSTLTDEERKQIRWEAGGRITPKGK